MISKNIKVLFLVTEDWYFYSHRLAIARAVRNAGCEIIVATRVTNHRELIEKEGFRVVPIKLRRRSKNPFIELTSIIELIKIYRKERPTIVHQVAIKPVLYGSCAAKITGVPAIVNALSGLGFVFIANGWKNSIFREAIKFLYKLALLLDNLKVIFQNPDDRKTFVNAGIVDYNKTVIIKGSGVDPAKFKYSPEPKGIPVVMLASRMLWDKGIGELVEASRLLKASDIMCRVVLVGMPDPGNPASIPEDKLRGWHSEGIVEWWGHREDMPAVFSESHIVCLPSYREGLPKVLIEAASCGRAIVATDVPGCREIVRHGVNGLLVPPKDSKALARSLTILLQDPELRSHMGKKGREIAVSEFSEERVTKETIGVYRDLLKNHWPSKNESHALC